VKPALRHAAVLLAVPMLSACIMVPRTVMTYDPACRIVARQMTLQPVQVASIGGCANQACVTLVAAAAVTGLASTIVSGSIAVVGNVVYWIERQGQCHPVSTGTPPPMGPTTPAPATP
jgi:hypothetical protein